MSIFTKQFSIRLPLWGFVIFCIGYGIYKQGLDAACRTGILELENSWCSDTAYAEELAAKRLADQMAQQAVIDQARRQAELQAQQSQAQAKQSIELKQEFIHADWQERRSLCNRAFRNLEDDYPQFVDDVSILSLKSDWNEASFMRELQKFMAKRNQLEPERGEVGYRWALERYSNDLQISRITSRNPIVTWLGKGNIYCAVRIEPFAKSSEAIAITERSAVLRLAEMEGLLDQLRLPFDRQGDYAANYAHFEGKLIETLARYKDWPVAAKSLNEFLAKAIESVKATQAQTREGDGALSVDSQRVVRGAWADRLRALQDGVAQ